MAAQPVQVKRMFPSGPSYDPAGAKYEKVFRDSRTQPSDNFEIVSRRIFVRYQT